MLLERFDVVAGAQFSEPRFGDLRCADLGLEIAADVMRQPRVCDQRVPYVAKRLVVAVDAQGRDPEVLLPDVGGFGVVATEDGAAEVGDVPLRG